MTQQHYWNGMRVPYITAWSAEAVSQPSIIRLIGRGGWGIGYVEEEPTTDRRHEALWVRTALAPGRGRPDFARVNSLRQKRAMRFGLCQVCGREAARADERTLHLVGSDVPIREEETTTAPPVHPACALESIENCPYLRRKYAAALVEYTPLWGVAGIVYDPETLAPLVSPGARPDDFTHVHVADPRIRWTLANFTVISLHGVTPVFMDDLAAMAQEDAGHTAADGPLMNTA
ncbi:hypothetical protein [Streptomyces sp. NPDC055709]